MVKIEFLIGRLEACVILSTAYAITGGSGGVALRFRSATTVPSGHRRRHLQHRTGKHPIQTAIGRARNVVLPIISGSATAETELQVSSRAVAFELPATDREA